MTFYLPNKIQTFIVEQNIISTACLIYSKELTSINEYTGIFINAIVSYHYGSIAIIVIDKTNMSL